MRSTSDGAKLALVENEPGDAPRRKSLLERIDRLQLGKMTEEEVRKILTIDPATWIRIQGGQQVRPNSYAKAHAGLDAYVAEHGLEHLDQPQVVTASTFEFTAAIGALDVRFTAKGRPEDAEMIRRQVTEAVIEAMREAKSQPSD